MNNCQNDTYNGIDKICFWRFHGKVSDTGHSMVEDLKSFINLPGAMKSVNVNSLLP